MKAVVDGVAAEAACDWWADFESGGHDHDFLPGAHRTVLERSAARIVVEDRVRWLGVPVWRERFAARREGRAVAFEGENPLSRFEGRYAFEDERGATRIALEAVVWPKGPLGWVAWLGKPLVWLFVWLDLKGHARQIARELS